MKNEEEDEGASQATGEMDDQKHGSVIKPNLPKGEPLDRFFLMGLCLDTMA
jgi:hypothetical protein